ncbi:reverse transcriptase domain-containing protein [Vreelandella hamiltonii]|nr:reverse transcriptase domain-containing protein [Halomonas johnsoniae]
MLRAWKRVRANKGAAGIDGLDIAQTAEHLRWAWPDIRQQLLASRYYPQPVRRVAIPKPDGSERELGIPTVTDRLIQQALLQVLQPLIDPTFSEHSYGFRPGRRAHDAVQAAQRFAQQGYHTSYSQIWWMAVRRQSCLTDRLPALHPETGRCSRPVPAC